MKASGLRLLLFALALSPFFMVLLFVAAFGFLANWAAQGGRHGD